MTNPTSATFMTPDLPADETTFSVPQDGAPRSALLKSGYLLLPLHMRLFLSLLVRLDYHDLEQKKFFIPFKELLPDQHDELVRGDSTDQAIHEMCQNILSIRLHINKPEEEKFGSWNLMSTAIYDEEQDGVQIKFMDQTMPYLLQLIQGGTYPLADLNKLLELPPSDAQYLYGLLQEYGDFSHPAIDQDQLQLRLGRQPVEPQKRPYGQHQGSSQASEGLVPTDLPFAYELHRNGVVVMRFKVEFPNKPHRTLAFSLKKNKPSHS